ncbi:MAG TPA: ABC transporter permease [Sandaracinaceae bacterium LLY-WYZ-13_1]|nr:ABC transporter permease [Sandaracinaceae bacterium LLY-WYZ-13_1]
MSRWWAMLTAVMRKEVRQTARDRRMMALLVVAPLVQLFVFGHAVNLEVDDVPTVVVDRDDTHASRTHLRRLLADGTLTEVGRAPDAAEAQRWLEEGRAAVVIVVPSGFERDVVRGRDATVQAILDGSDPNRAGVAGAAVSEYFASESDGLARARLRRLAVAGGASSGIAPPSMSELDVRSRVLFNPGLETAVYMVPGVAAILLMLITTIVTAMGLSRERERGTLEQILVTPVPSGVLILGKILPFAVFGLVDFGLALLVGSYVFDMPLRGDFVVLFTGTVLYLLTTLGMGLLISTLSGSQQQAFMGGFLFMLPAALLSGIMTPIHSMPGWLQPLTLANPLRHYAEVIRAVLLRGAGWSELPVPLAVLAAMGLFVFTFATLRFRRSVG